MISGIWGQEKEVQELNDFDWHGSSVETESVPMVDDQKGEKFVLRHFEFKINPEIIGRALDKQELFNAHWKQIKTMLWSDGLVAVDEVAPRVVLETELYRIFITCRPRLGLGVMTTINEKPTNLQDIFKPQDLTKP